MVSWIRVVKGALSSALVVGSLGFYAHGRLTLTASYAVVAGPATVVRAPADGVLTHQLRTFALLSAGAELAVVNPIPKNDPVLRAAEAELTTVRAEVESLKRVIALGQDMQERTESRRAVLVGERKRHLEQLLEQAEAALEVKKASRDAADLEQNRSVRLCTAGLVGTGDCENATSRARVSAREVDTATSQVGIAQFLLNASRSGADVGQDLGSEVTYARQQRDDLTLRLATLRQQLETEEARAQALDLRVNPPATTATIGAKSITWSVFNQSGAKVGKGDPLFQIVDCSDAFIFATTTEDRYKHLRVGMQANVKIDDHVVPGQVVQLLGPYGTFTQDGSMEPRPPVILNNADASSAGVAVGGPELTRMLERECPIGRRVEVEFVKDR